MSEFDILFEYSEWLDGEGLIIGDKASRDKRTHEELVTDFLQLRAEREIQRGEVALL